MKLYQNRLINKRTKAITIFSSKNSNCVLYLNPTKLKRERVQTIVTPNITVMFQYLIWPINTSTKAMVKGEHVCCVRRRGRNSAIMT